MNAEQILENVREISDQFATERNARQKKRELVKADFDRLRDAGFLLTAVPTEHGGIWESPARSVRPISEILRVLAHGDSSVALVSSMHPAVIYSMGWLSFTEAPDPFRDVWEEQRRLAFESAGAGAWWGTITSEPGSGGDLARTKAAARRGSSEGEYLLSGLKHFGSGSGITSFMVTSAVPEGETEPDWFYLDMRGVPWDGSRGAKLIAAWDGHGMTATQSHSFMFEDFPVTRTAWPGTLQKIMKLGGFVPCLFSAVIVGIVETAILTAHQQLEKWHDSLRPYEQVEWSRVEMEGWLIQQAYEGMLRAAEEKENASFEVLQGKTAIAELAETTLARICKIVGGGTYNRYSPFGFWYEDVRALGFLRPPWGLAYSALFAQSWPSTNPPQDTVK